MPTCADHAALAGECLDHRALLIGEHLGLDVGDAEPLGYGFGSGAVVAGQHDDADAVRRERFQRGGGRLLHRIGNGDDAGGLAVDREEDRRRAFATQALCLGRHG
jgi:hypothetical protein